MARVGRYGTFLHIPKTGGQFLRNVLAAVDSARWESGPYHGYPDEWDWSKPIFTTLRHPAYWLRSMWGHLARDGWYEKNGAAVTDSPLWNNWTRMVVPYRSDTFEGFISNLYPQHAGIVTWYHGLYIPPGVQVLKLHSLREQVIELVPETEKYYDKVYYNHPNNRNQGSNLEPIDDRMVDYIEVMELEYFNRWGRFESI